MVRVRFAPSPTGPLHIGGVRTALYNYFFCTQNKGKFILRIEDTDQSRYVSGAEEYILESLAWCGIQFDEGINIGGEYGPYRQSDRTGIYREYINILIQKGAAYYAFETPDELNQIRKEYESRGETFQYGINNRMNLKNSLSLPASEVKKLLDTSHPHVIRFKVPEAKEVTVNDLIRDEIKVNSIIIDDKVLFKSDGMPTYHLANIVDDHLMKISHVIRGEEWLPSLPLHVLIYQAFDWEVPEFAHLPLILRPDGKGKLSKRDGDRLGFSVYPISWQDPKTKEIYRGFREDGYYSEAFVNMLALLGWNPGDDREIMSMEEMIEAFDLKDVHKSGARFDPIKARWFNHVYLQKRDIKLVAQEFKDELSKVNINVTLEEAVFVAELMRERVDFVKDLVTEAIFFFKTPETLDPKAIKKWGTDNSAQWLKDILLIINDIEPFDSEKIDEALNNYLKEKNVKAGNFFNTLRICIVGTSKGPHLSTIMQFIGKQETINRIERGISYFE
ncbi:MAG: glutamate--tRNA ligase [Bacteroidales bacterium]|nr:glutamate--tRNA ligase [Bacteroidales bacterium]